MGEEHLRTSKNYTFLGGLAEGWVFHFSFWAETFFCIYLFGQPPASAAAPVADEGLNF